MQKLILKQHKDIFNEPGLMQLISEGISKKKLIVTSNFKSVKTAHVIITSGNETSSLLVL